MQKMEQMELELQTLKNIARVKEMLEQSKKIDQTQRYMEQLEELVIAWRANLSNYAEIAKSEISI